MLGLTSTANVPPLRNFRSLGKVDRKAVNHCLLCSILRIEDTDSSKLEIEISAKYDSPKWDVILVVNNKILNVKTD